MRFIETPIPGAFEIQPAVATDSRGSFARIFDQQLFAEHGLRTDVMQAAVSMNRSRGTLRGLHLQVGPHAETKVVSCTRGAIFDVVVDLRRNSPSYLTWFGTTLDDGTGRALYIPRGCAHGFQTLSDDAAVAYLISAPYVANSNRGVRYDDRTLAIAWPLELSVISDRDRALPSIAEWEQLVAATGRAE